MAFDQRGHGESAGAMDGRAVDDVATMAGVLPAGLPVALRGSSMGGYLALVAAAQARRAPRWWRSARPRPSAGPAGCATGASTSGPTAGPLQALPDRARPLDAVVPDAAAELLLLHAEGDEQRPRRPLARAARGWPTRAARGSSRSRAAHHRSVQHDPELQALALRFLENALAAG